MFRSSSSEKPFVSAQSHRALSDVRSEVTGEMTVITAAHTLRKYLTKSYWSIRSPSPLSSTWQGSSEYVPESMERLGTLQFCDTSLREGRWGPTSSSEDLWCPFGSSEAIVSDNQKKPLLQSYLYRNTLHFIKKHTYIFQNYWLMCSSVSFFYWNMILNSWDIRNNRMMNMYIYTHCNGKLHTFFSFLRLILPLLCMWNMLVACRSQCFWEQQLIFASFHHHWHTSKPDDMSASPQTPSIHCLCASSRTQQWCNGPF